ncbi:MAG: hypothetical protein HYZ44_07260 [Bacteroidetes bacterium]|nr:hypothetical protein [Bacteroidota bacterium]
MLKLSSAVLFVIGLSFIYNHSFGQAMRKGSLGLEVGFPTGKGSENASTGFGGSFRYESAFKNSDKASWLFSVGYISFPANVNLPGYNVSGSTSIIPVTLGVKYYPNGSFNGFYFGGEMGLAAITAKVTVSGFGSVSASENKFMFAPNVGYHFSGFDLTIRYNAISDGNFFGIRGAFTF